MRTKRQRLLCCEALESKELLSGFHAAFQAGTHPRLERLLELRAAHVAARAQSAAVGGITSAQQDGGAAMVQGMGITLGPALSNADTQTLQQIASANNLITFLNQLAALHSTNPTIQQNAQLFLNDGRAIDLQMHELADSKGLTLPSDISQQDQGTARQVVSAINTPGFDQAYGNALNQAAQEIIGLLQTGTASQDMDFQNFSKSALAIIQGDQALAQGGGSGSGSGSAMLPGPNSTTLDAQDLQTLEQSYSTNLTERFLAQLTALQTNNSGLQLYADKLMNDHEQETVSLGRYAAATGSFLPGSIQGQDVQTSDFLIGSANSRRYPHLYLWTMIRSHIQDIQSNQQTIATTQNPALRQFAMDDIPTDWLHMTGARSLLFRGR